ncbi:TetR/AcrR family transcriptional regulator [Saccharomonospora xinjiangensis]|uniref:Transcriptional regulator n=1 Tax=Saccharomonospora xinjiangensis XJ-54 TaxID=882086 RepID=I0V639_9PSEU|nr:TetR family transcriptional regulator [Saccharomonospora xinjiangensis]EID55592.1 transcriptional regulator [Saccharomonospora xinjiangensis XJ-54]
MTTARENTRQPQAARRRGRRPAGADTRAGLLAAARDVFAESGYHNATVRAIAARAGVDAAMVNHWFGGKDGLFAQAVLNTPFDVREIIEDVTADGPDRLGENIVRRFVATWDGAGGSAFVALVRSISTHGEALEFLKKVLLKKLLPAITAAAGSDRPDLRAALCATQLLGLGMARYVAEVQPVAAADVEALVATVAPTLQHYLTGDLGEPIS